MISKLSSTGTAARLEALLLVLAEATDADFAHADGRVRVISRRLHLGDGRDHVHAAHHLAKHGMTRRTTREPIEKGVVGDVEEGRRRLRCSEAQEEYALEELAAKYVSAVMALRPIELVATLAEDWCTH